MHTSSAFFGLLSAFRRPQFLGEVIVKDFIPWALWLEPLRILRMYIEYAKVVGEILSITFLLGTLLSPWKGIAEDMPSIVRWDQFLQAFFVNLVTRGIGMVIRLLAIVVSLVLQVALFALFIVLFLGWFIFPALAVTGLSFAIILL